MTAGVDLGASLASVQERIARAARRSGRDPAEVTLVAVSKTQPPDVILRAYELGLRDFGENRVEEAEAKLAARPDGTTWHMVGHIQSRKAKRVPELFQIVHSVDSVELAAKLDRACAGRTEPLPVLLELNVSGEAAKFGFRAGDWEQNSILRSTLFSSVEEIVALPQLRVEGLMTMAPIVSRAEEARPVFRRLRGILEELRRNLPGANWQHLSMGMSDDFEVAVEEGATLVRIGRAIFAPDRPAWRA